MYFCRKLRAWWKLQEVESFNIIKYIHKLKDKVEFYKEVEDKVQFVIVDIKLHLYGQSIANANQSRVGYKQLFREFIVE